MTSASSSPVSQPQLCPICHYAALSEPWNDKTRDPPCPHCRACGRGLFLGMGFPLAIITALILLGMCAEWIGPARVAWLAGLPEWLLIVPPIAHLAYADWLIWYAAGLRLRLAFIMAVQVGMTTCLMWYVPLAVAVLSGAFY
jgi:hypothetical protein